MSSEEMKPKRKTKTSSAVKARYNAKAYQQYTVSFKRIEDADIIEQIEAERAQGLSASEAIKKLIRKS